MKTMHLDAKTDLDRQRRSAVNICIAVTFVVAVAEVAVGWSFNLVSVTVEGFHTGADLFDSLVAFVLVRIASQPADNTHPFGHGKFDSLASIIEGSFVALTALWAIYKATLVLLGFEQADPNPEIITLVVMGGASVLYFVVSRSLLAMARRVHSPVVYAEAMHLRSHIYITIGLALGLGVSRLALDYGVPGAERVDSIVALMLGVFLLSVAYRIIRPGFHQLMDAALPGELVEQITTCLNEFRNEFVEIHALRTRAAGMDRHVDIHLVVQPDTTVQDAHDLAHRIETRLMNCVPGSKLLVHLEPALGRTWRAYVERERIGEVVLSSGSPVAGEADHHEDARAHEI